MDPQTHRQRATSKLDHIAQEVRKVLAEHGIDISLFFLVPGSGDAIVSFGAIGNPPDDLWADVSELVCKVVTEAVGVERVRCRDVVCAATDGASS